MTNSTANRPYPALSRPAALLGLLLSATAYALLLSTPRGRRWASRQTWATVVAGVMLVSGWQALEAPRSAGANFAYFAVAGVPIVFRSLWLQLEEFDALMRAHMEEVG